MLHPAKALLPHSIAVDTNILWCHDKEMVVDPGFDSFLDEQLQAMDLRLVLPTVVRGEILFQQTMSALKSLERANEGFNRVSAITGKVYSHQVTETRVRREVVQRFDAWIASRGATLIDVPYATTDWAKIVSAAIWREPPFTRDENHPDLEKGFRDALILESICAYSATHTDRPFAFICGDRLLRETAEARVESLSHVSTYESLDDFKSYLRLTQETQTTQFAQSLHAKARAKFFALDDPHCLYKKEGLWQRLMSSEFSDHFVPGESAGSEVETRERAQWKGALGSVLQISPTQFVRLDDPRDFHWSNQLIFARTFEPRQLFDDHVPSVPIDRILVVRLRADWHAEVRANGAFYRAAVDSVEFIERRFLPASDENRELYRLND